MSIDTRIKRRMPHEEAKALMDRLGTWKAAKDYCLDELCNAKRSSQASWLHKVLAELKQLKPKSKENNYR